MKLPASTLALTVLPVCLVGSVVRNHPGFTPCEVNTERAYYLISSRKQKDAGGKPSQSDTWFICDADYAERFYLGSQIPYRS